jgi:hypothetical protein
MNSQIAGPSLRKKNSTTIISTRPVAKLPTAPAPASAPEPKEALVTKPTTVSRTFSTCSSVIENGSVVMKSCSWPMPFSADDTSEAAWFSTAHTTSQPTRPSTARMPKSAMSVASSDGTRCFRRKDTTGCIAEAKINASSTGMVTRLSVLNE